MSDLVQDVTMTRFRDVVRKLVEQESPTGDVERVEAVGDLLVDEVMRRGGRVEREEGPGYGAHLIARFGGDDLAHQAAERRSILLVGHMDTVHPVGRLTEMPFEERDGRITGPGVYDMKSGVTLALEAVSEVVRRRDEEDGPGLSSPVTLLVTTDEEVGSPTSRALIERLARESRAALVFEPSLPGGKVKVGRKGVADYRIRVHGVPAHAGIEPEKGASATHALIAVLAEVVALARPDDGTTVSVGTLSGGTTMNVIADRAEASIDVRFWTTGEADRVDAAIRSLSLGDPRCTLEIDGGVNRYPLEETDASRALFERAVELGSEVGFTVEGGRTGGGSDGNFTSAVGCPTLDGLGPDGGGAHAKHEHILTAGLATRLAWIVRLLESL